MSHPDPERGTDGRFERLRRRRAGLLKAYLVHVGWFTSTIASASTGSLEATLATSLWLTLLTAVPVLVYTAMVHTACRAIEPGARSCGPLQIAISVVCFTPFEAGLVLPAINLWVSRGVLRRCPAHGRCRNKSARTRRPPLSG